MNDLINRQAAIDAVKQHKVNVLGERKWSEGIAYGYEAAHEHICEVLAALPSAQSETLTDSEKRIFLASMGREERVCKEVDAEMTREPYEDSLVRVCREIERKVKKALWTN